MAIDLQALGSKLKRVRQTILQRSQEEICAVTAIPLQRLDALERGVEEPTGDEILILADSYKEPFEFFISNERSASIEKADELYRKFGSAFTPDDRMNIQEFLYLCRTEHEFEEMMGGRPRVHHFDPVLRGSYKKGHGEQNAARLRQAIGLEQEPLGNVFGILRQLGCHIFRRKLGRSDISGVFIRHEVYGNCILINYDEDLYRQNFSALHELGHAIFDKDYAVNLSFHREKTDSQHREKRANTFAGRMLIPKAVADSARLPRDLEGIADVIEDICRKYAANFTPGLISFKESQKITQDQYQQLEGKRRIRRAEKEDPEISGEPPGIQQRRLHMLERGLSPEYVELCFDVYRNLHITRGRLSEALLIHEDELPVVARVYHEAL